MSTTVMAPPLPDAPYRGIEPFRFTDQQIFAAREDETWTLLSNVTLYRAVLLYGESGTGKSSLVNAGLLPLVLKENYVPDRLRVQPFAGREIKVERIRQSTAGDQPTYLPSNFAPADSGSAESIELSLKDFRARLEQFRPTTGEQESAGIFLPPSSAPRPLLIFDQFEEFITLFEEAQRVGTSAETTLASTQVPAAQQDILATLVELIQDETLPVKIIFSFREDYLAKLSILFDLCPELLDQSQRLLPPGIEALAQIIRAPFIDPALRAHFLQQKGGTGSELSEELAEEIARELGRRSKGDTANLTELQIVCQRLWEADNPERLFVQDGIEGLLTGYGSDVFRHFTPELRNAAVVLLSHMVTASNTRNIVSEEDLLSRTAQCDFNTSQCTDALAALSRSQIVRREPRHSIYFYEITSEYLVPWIKDQVAERKSAEERQLAEAAQQKLEAERLQAVAKFEAAQRRGRVLRRLLTAMILLLVVTFLLGAFAYRQYRRAAAAEAQSERILNALRLVTSKNPDDTLLGLSEVDLLIKENKIPSELKSVLITPASTSKDERVKQAANKVLAEAAKSDHELQKSIDTLTPVTQPRFFLHIQDKSQWTQAKQVAARLRQEGYLVPGIEEVGEKGVRSNQLRYFRESDPGIPTAQEIVNLLDKANLGKWNARRVPGYENSTKVVAGQFELWFAFTPAASNDSPSATGTLVLQFFTADGASQSLPPLVSFVVKDSSGKAVLNNQVGKSTSIKLPLKEDTYTVIVNVSGNRPQTQKAIIKAGETKSLMFNIRANTSGPQQQASPQAYQFVDPADNRRRRNP